MYRIKESEVYLKFLALIVEIVWYILFDRAHVFICSISKVVFDKFTNRLKWQFLILLLMSSLVLMDDLVPCLICILMSFLFVSIEHFVPGCIIVALGKLNIFKCIKIIFNILLHAIFDIFLRSNQTSNGCLLHYRIRSMLFKIKLVVKVMHLFHDDHWLAIKVLLFLLWCEVNIEFIF